MATAAVGFISRGVAGVTWVWGSTATGSSNVLALGNYSECYAYLTGPSGGTSSLSLQGAIAATGPWTVLTSASGLALTLTDAEPAVLYKVHENMPYLKAVASTATEAGLTLGLTVKYLQNVAG
tara:strand:- start:194 stop:562 length:369 start_codon:yes stop_codon:yes gene_type:complete